MNNYNNGEDFHIPEIVRKLSCAQSSAELIKIFSIYLKTLSLGPFVLAEVRSAKSDWRENMVLSTMPEAYFDEFWKARTLFDNPLIRAGLHFCGSVPLADTYTDQHLTRRERKAYQHAEKFGFEKGHVFPLKGRDRHITVLFVVGDFSAITPNQITLIEMAATAMYRRACALLPDQHASNRRPHGDLSLRERDALTWAAQGKTDWEIAQLLEISDRTVHFHIENAKKKMMVSTRLQAVVKAILTFEILP